MGLMCPTCHQEVPDRRDAEAGREGGATFAGAARTLGVPVYRIQQMVQRGELRTAAINGRTYIQRDSLIRAMGWAGLGPESTDERLTRWERTGGALAARAAEIRLESRALAEADELRAAGIAPLAPAEPSSASPAARSVDHDPLAAFKAKHIGGR